MKKILVVLLSIMMIFSLTSCGKKEVNKDYSVAMISDNKDIYDGSFNQTIYESLKKFCEDNSVNYRYYIKEGDTLKKKVDTIKKAIDDKYNVIVLPGSDFSDSLKEVADKYSDVKFISIDVSNEELGSYKLTDNVYCASYQEEIAGFMAGYAAVKLGYKNLGFLGGAEYPAIKRYGYGFVQGAENAASELKIKDVNIKFGYVNQFNGDEHVTSYMNQWYKDGTEVVFSCGGPIYTSVAEAAINNGGKIIGVDVDQSYIIDSSGTGTTLTSAMKSMGLSIETVLDDMVNNNNWINYGGKCETLGLVSADDPEANFVKIPMDTTQWNETFTQDDYKDLVSKLFNKEIKVSSYINNIPKVKQISVDYLGNINTKMKD